MCQWWLYENSNNAIHKTLLFSCFSSVYTSILKAYICVNATDFELRYRGKQNDDWHLSTDIDIVLDIWQHIKNIRYIFCVSRSLRWWDIVLFRRLLWSLRGDSVDEAARMSVRRFLCGSSMLTRASSVLHVSFRMIAFGDSLIHLAYLQV